MMHQKLLYLQMQTQILDAPQNPNWETYVKNQDFRLFTLITNVTLPGLMATLIHTLTIL